MRVFLIGSAQYLAFVRSGGAHQPFIIHAGDDVLHLSIAISVSDLGIKWLEAWRQNDRSHFYFYLLRRLTEIDGLVLTDSFADAAFLLFQVDAAFVYVRDQGNGLSEVDVNGFVLR